MLLNCFITPFPTTKHSYCISGMVVTVKGLFIFYSSEVNKKNIKRSTIILHTTLTFHILAIKTYRWSSTLALQLSDSYRDMQVGHGWAIGSIGGSNMSQVLDHFLGVFCFSSPWFSTAIKTLYSMTVILSLQCTCTIITEVWQYRFQFDFKGQICFSYMYQWICIYA